MYELYPYKLPFCLGNYGSVKAVNNDAAQYGETSLANGIDGGKYFQHN